LNLQQPTTEEAKDKQRLDIEYSQRRIQQLEQRRGLIDEQRHDQDMSIYMDGAQNAKRIHQDTERDDIESKWKRERNLARRRENELRHAALFELRKKLKEDQKRHIYEQSIMDYNAIDDIMSSMNKLKI
jgi:hypothetical protein